MGVKTDIQKSGVGAAIIEEAVSIWLKEDSMLFGAMLGKWR